MSERALEDIVSSELAQGPTAIAMAAVALGPAVPMHQMLANLCAIQGCTFTLNGKPCDAISVLSPEMFLPVIAWTVQDAGQDLLGEDLGCALKVDKDAMFGARTVVPHVTGNIADVVRGLFFIHAATNLFGLRPNASIEVSPIFEMLREHFRALLEGLSNFQGEIPWPQARLS